MAHPRRAALDAHRGQRAPRADRGLRGRAGGAAGAERLPGRRAGRLRADRPRLPRRVPLGLVGHVPHHDGAADAAHRLRPPAGADDRHQDRRLARAALLGRSAQAVQRAGADDELRHHRQHRLAVPPHEEAGVPGALQNFPPELANPGLRRLLAPSAGGQGLLQRARSALGVLARGDGPRGTLPRDRRGGLRHRAAGHLVESVQAGAAPARSADERGASQGVAM